VATKSAGEKKEVDFLIKAVKARGYNVVPSGGGHKKVVDKHGKSVVDANGPLLISSSPSEVRWRDMHVSRLMKAGVLKEDPWNPEEKERRSSGGDPARNRRVSEAVQRKQASRQERTKKIRAKLEPIVARLGGWDKRGFVADLGRVQYHLAKSMGRVETPKSLASAIQNARQMKMGGTLSDHNALCWELLIDDLERHDRRDRDHGLLNRWAELQRGARGLPIEDEEESLPSAQAAILELTGPRTLPEQLPAPSSNGRPEPHPAAGPTLPRMAIEIAARMGASIRTDDDMNRVLVLSERIARLELEEDHDHSD